MPKQRDEPVENGWAETKLDPFPNDTLLRAAGFRIHDRRKRSQPRWHRDGEFYRGGPLFTTEEAAREAGIQLWVE